MPYQTLFEFAAPTRLVFGPGAIQQVPRLLEDAGEGRTLIVTDPGIRSAGLLDRLTAVLDRAGRSYAVFDETEANPSAETVERCARRYLDDGCGMLIAIGGGSSMDVAKGTGILATNGGRVMEYEGMNKVRQPIPFLLCIPTTYGTGSEVTPFSVITDRSRQFKATIGSPLIVPAAAVLDPDLSVRLPIPIAGATGMDALTHGIEAYVCLAGNTVTRAFAIQAIELIAANLRQAAASDHHVAATEQMLIAATLAGHSFAFTRLGNVHAMAHPLGAHFNIPHGVANAVLLPHVMEYNLMACPDQYARIAAAMGEEVRGLSAMDAARRAVAAVRTLSADVGIPANLAALGARREAFPAMAADAMKSGNIPVNPRKTGLEDILMLFERAYA